MSQYHLILKVLTGRHEGAEANFSVSQLTIGPDDSCDIILSDDAMVAANLQRKEDETIALQIEDEEEKILHPPCLFYVNDVLIGLGQRGTNWQELSHPHQEHDEITSPLADSSSSHRIDSSSAQRSHYGSFFVMSFSALVIVAFVGSATFHWSSHQKLLSKPPHDISMESDTPNPLSFIVSFLAGQDEFSDVTAVSLKDGTIRIEGSVREESSLAELRNHIEELKEHVIETHIVVTSQVATSLKDGLEAYGVNLDVHDEGAGAFRLVGVVDSYPSYEQALSHIRSDLPSITKIHNQVTTFEQFVARLRESANREKLAIAVERHRHVIKTYGLLNSEDFKRWYDVKEVLLVAYGRHLLMEDYVKLVPDFALSIQTIVKGPRSFVVLHNRSVVEEGASLPDGFTLAAIKSDRLLLKHGGIDYNYVFATH